MKARRTVMGSANPLPPSVAVRKRETCELPVKELTPDELASEAVDMIHGITDQLIALHDCEHSEFHDIVGELNEYKDRLELIFRRLIDRRAQHETHRQP